MRYPAQQGPIPTNRRRAPKVPPLCFCAVCRALSPARQALWEKLQPRESTAPKETP